MQLITDQKESGYHLSKRPGCEWWYFDGIDEENEYSFIVIFYVGNPFSPGYNSLFAAGLSEPSRGFPDPRDFCCVSIRLFLKGRELYGAMYEYKKNRFNIISDGNAEKTFIDKSSFYFDDVLKRYYLNIHLLPLDTEKKLKAEFVFTSGNRQNRISKSGSGTENDFFFLPSSPVCNFTGKFKFYKNLRRTKTDLTGQGFHYHVWGFEPVFLNIHHWNFGRVMTGEYSVVFLNVKFKDDLKPEFKKILIYKNDVLIFDKNDFKMKVSSSANYLFLFYPSRVVIEFDEVKFEMVRSNIVDSGPAHVRYLSRNDLTVKDTKVLEGALGISEFIKPPRMKSGVFKSVMSKKLNKEES